MKTSIGTQKEKTLHRFLKNYICPDESKQEIPINNWIVDIFIENEIYEIQTRSFNALRRKLASLLSDYKTTIVYPFAKIKYITWVNRDGTLSKPRKSPKSSHPLRSCLELYQIKLYLNHPNLKIKIFIIELHEFRLRDKTNLKKGSCIDQRLVNVFEIIDIACTDDYINLIPFESDNQFTTNDLIKKTKMSKKEGAASIQVLKAIKAINFIGKQGRSYLYQINQKKGL